MYTSIQWVEFYRAAKLGTPRLGVAQGYPKPGQVSLTIATIFPAKQAFFQLRRDHFHVLASRT